VYETAEGSKNMLRVVRSTLRASAATSAHPATEPTGTARDGRPRVTDRTIGNRARRCGRRDDRTEVKGAKSRSRL
jgi:hypothetical protein